MKDEISEIIEDEEKSEKLNKLIDEKVEEKIDKRFKQKAKQEKKAEKEEVSRRGFMKKIGAGALGLGALSISPVSAYDIKSSHGLEVWSEGNQHLEVQNGEVDLFNNNLTRVNQINGQAVDDLGVTDHSNLSNVTSDQHHPQFTASDARTAINNDSDHGSTAPHNYFSEDYNDLNNRSHGNEDHDTNFLGPSDYSPVSDVDGSTLSDLTMTGQVTFNNSSNDFWRINDDSGGSNTSPHTARFDDRDLRYYAGTGSGTVLRVNQDGSANFPEGPLNISGNQVATQTWVNNNADVPNADSADTAGTADSLSGNNVTSVNGETGDVSVQGIPSGVITMWSGSTSDVPSGWTLCDGNNENGMTVPDLRNRFVVGAGDQYSADKTGGSQNISLSVNQLPSHDHGNGNLTVDNHIHGSGTLGANNGGEHGHFKYAKRSIRSYNQNSEGDYLADSGGAELQIKTESNPDDWDYVSSSNNPIIGIDGSHSHGVSGNTGGSSPNISGSTDSTGTGSKHENRPPFYALAYIMKL